MTSTPEVAVSDTEPDTDEDEVEPVELLVQLAEEGEIDPWDIDVVEVTDAFLARLDKSDLRTSGRALFYASVLLRMKSDIVVGADEPDPDAEPAEDHPPWEAPLDGAEGRPGSEGLGDPIEALEAEMERRLDRKTARGTPETLDELVRELREAERGSWWKNSRTYDTTESGDGPPRGIQTVSYRSNDLDREGAEPTEDEVTGTAHGEDIEATTEAVLEAVTARLGGDREEVLFAEIDSAAGSRVETFLGLLFLTHRGTVSLEQDDLFGDLWISTE